MKLIRLSAGAAIVVAASLLSAQGVQAAVTSGAVRTVDSTPCATKLISAHEGARYNADGDTLDSQNAAYRIGANLADTDVWVTADNNIVQIHDADVSHSTTGTGIITDMAIDQWGALRTTQYQEPVPTLEQSLALPRLAANAGRYLMMETKYSFNLNGSPDTAKLQMLVDKIQAAGMESHVVIYSEYFPQLAKLKELDPALTVWAKPLDRVPAVTEVEGFDGVMLAASLMTAQNVADFHAAGLKVIRQRTAESLDNWNAFLATGADGLMTDSPKLMISRCRALG